MEFINAKKDVYSDFEKKEIKKARIAAEKAMWSEKEMVDHYVGATRSQDVLVSLKLRKINGYNEEYWLSYVFTNDKY